MLRKLYISIIFILLGLFALAQTPVLTIEAAKLYEQKELQRAKEKIDAAILMEDGKTDSYTWHVRGHIYKELYKLIDNRAHNSINREKSVDSFFKAMEYDTQDKFKQMNYNVLKTFFIPSYYNDVVNLMNNRNSQNINEIKRYYEKYREVQLRLEPNYNLDVRDINFLKAYATSYRKIIEEHRSQQAHPKNYEEELSKVRELYKAAIRIDTLDYGANYNLAINLYNEAAYVIESLGEQTSIDSLIIIQDYCVKLFKEALPYALTAYKLKPERVEINKALRAIYYSLLLEKKRAWFDENLKELKKGRALDGPEFQEWKMKYERNAVSIHQKCVKSLSKDIEGVNFNIEGEDMFERLDVQEDQPQLRLPGKGKH